MCDAADVIKSDQDNSDYAICTGQKEQAKIMVHQVTNESRILVVM
jgi:hypothetical protein